MTPIWVAAAVRVGEFAGSPSGLAVGSSALASPKSSTLTVPSGVTLMLAGFRSRWTTPASCAASRASAICRATSSASSIGRAPCAIRSARVGPSTSSSTSALTTWPELVPSSVEGSDSSSPWMPAMLGWFSEARTFASLSNRASRSGSVTNASGSTLIATSRSRPVSLARYTSPIPPSPILAVIEYGPSAAPGSSVIDLFPARFLGRSKALQGR